MAQQANKAQARRLWQQGCRRDAARRGKELEDLQPHARTVLSTATVTQLFGGERENSRISRRAVEPRGRETPSAPGPSSAAGHHYNARCILYPSRGESSFTPDFFHHHHPGLFGKTPGLSIILPSPPPLSAAEWLSGTCIIYLLGNIYWDLVFNNCHSNISFLNPLRSVAVAILNIYQRSLCVHC